MNRARITFRDPAWYGRTGTIVNRTPCSGAWIRLDEWPAGEPDLVGRGEIWLDETWFERAVEESAVQEAA